MMRGWLHSAFVGAGTKDAKQPIGEGPLVTPLKHLDNTTDNKTQQTKPLTTTSRVPSRSKLLFDWSIDDSNDSTKARTNNGGGGAVPRNIDMSVVMSNNDRDVEYRHGVPSEISMSGSKSVQATLEQSKQQSRRRRRAASESDMMNYLDLGEEDGKKGLQQQQHQQQQGESTRRPRSRSSTGFGRLTGRLTSKSPGPLTGRLSGRTKESAGTGMDTRSIIPEQSRECTSRRQSGATHTSCGHYYDRNIAGMSSAKSLPGDLIEYMVALEQDEQQQPQEQKPDVHQRSRSLSGIRRLKNISSRSKDKKLQGNSVEVLKGRDNQQQQQQLPRRYSGATHKSKIDMSSSRSLPEDLDDHLEAENRQQQQKQKPAVHQRLRSASGIGRLRNIRSKSKEKKSNNGGNEKPKSLGKEKLKVDDQYRQGEQSYGMYSGATNISSGVPGECSKKNDTSSSRSLPDLLNDYLQDPQQQQPTKKTQNQPVRRRSRSADHLEELHKLRHLEEAHKPSRQRSSSRSSNGIYPTHVSSSRSSSGLSSRMKIRSSSRGRGKEELKSDIPGIRSSRRNIGVIGITNAPAASPIRTEIPCRYSGVDEKKNNISSSASAQDILDMLNEQGGHNASGQSVSGKLAIRSSSLRKSHRQSSYSRPPSSYSIKDVLSEDRKEMKHDQQQGRHTCRHSSSSACMIPNLPDEEGIDDGYNRKKMPSSKSTMSSPGVLDYLDDLLKDEHRHMNPFSQAGSGSKARRHSSLRLSGTLSMASQAGKEKHSADQGHRSKSYRNDPQTEKSSADDRTRNDAHGNSIKDMLDLADKKQHPLHRQEKPAHRRSASTGKIERIPSSTTGRMGRQSSRRSSSFVLPYAGDVRKEQAKKSSYTRTPHISSQSQQDELLMEWPTKREEPARYPSSVIAEHSNDVASNKKDKKGIVSSNSVPDMLDYLDENTEYRNGQQRGRRSQRPAEEEGRPQRRHSSSSTQMMMGTCKPFNSYYCPVRKGSAPPPKDRNGNKISVMGGASSQGAVTPQLPLSNKKKKRVKFSDKQSINCYVKPSDINIRDLFYSRHDDSAFSDLTVNHARSIRSYIKSSIAQNDESFNALTGLPSPQALKKHLLSPEDIIGIEHLLCGRGIAKASLNLKRNHAKLLIDEQRRAGGLIDDPVLLANRLRKYSNISAKLAVCRAAYATMF